MATKKMPAEKRAPLGKSTLQKAGVTPPAKKLSPKTPKELAPVRMNVKANKRGC
jgi:hypothetical protein